MMKISVLKVVKKRKEGRENIMKEQESMKKKKVEFEKEPNKVSGN